MRRSGWSPDTVQQARSFSSCRGLEPAFAAGDGPPEHTRLRRLVAPAFTPRRMAKYETLVAQRIGELLDGLDPSTGFDLVSEFAAPLPVTTISALLGVSDVDEKAFAGHGATLATAIDDISSVGHLRRLVHAQKQLRQIFADLFEHRTSDPATTSSPRRSATS